jgi:hypothetical protein
MRESAGLACAPAGIRNRQEAPLRDWGICEDNRSARMLAKPRQTRR